MEIISDVVYLAGAIVFFFAERGADTGPWKVIGRGARRTWCEDPKSTEFFQRRPHL
ncbi:MAG: hypothetical protein MPW14_00550 [Candidatus Manganitrophus sp.]|nr:MAG: hypothetical protein MPW14_00550 [Candidatus Manganitrophus sp.]